MERQVAAGPEHAAPGREHELEVGRVPQRGRADAEATRRRRATTTNPAAPMEIDLVAAPGLAFDRSGGRIGYGGGYFDGFLRRVRSDCAVAGVCFAEQLVAEVPAGPDDVRVDVVVTDAEVIRPANL